MRVVVVRTYMEMRSQGEGRPDFPEIAGLEVRPAGPADAAAYRETFEDIGQDVLWVDRRDWQIGHYEEHLRKSHVRAWLARLDGDPAGLIEIALKDDGSIQMTYFGVRPRYQGRGLGKYLVSYFIERSWEMKPSRVWLFTLTLDGEHAAANYLKRGFRVWKRRAAFIVVPDTLAPKVRELVESARARGVHPGFLRHVEAHLRGSPPGIAARQAVFEIKRGARTLMRLLRPRSGSGPRP